MVEDSDGRTDPRRDLLGDRNCRSSSRAIRPAPAPSRSPKAKSPTSSSGRLPSPSATTPATARGDRAVVESGDSPGQQRGPSRQDRITREPARAGREVGKDRRPSWSNSPSWRRSADVRRNRKRRSRSTTSPGRGPSGRTARPATRTDQLERVSVTPLRCLPYQGKRRIRAASSMI